MSSTPPLPPPLPLFLSPAGTKLPTPSGIFPRSRLQDCPGRRWPRRPQPAACLAEAGSSSSSCSPPRRQEPRAEKPASSPGSFGERRTARLLPPPVPSQPVAAQVARASIGHLPGVSAGSQQVSAAGGGRADRRCRLDVVIGPGSWGGELLLLLLCFLPPPIREKDQLRPSCSLLQESLSTTAATPSLPLLRQPLACHWAREAPVGGDRRAGIKNHMGRPQKRGSSLFRCFTCKGYSPRQAGNRKLGDGLAQFWIVFSFNTVIAPLKIHRQVRKTFFSN